MALQYPGGLTAADFSDGSTDSGWQPQSYLYGAHIVIASSGTVTQLGVKGYTRGGGGATAVKIGLYTSGGTLVVQSTTTISGSTPAWFNSGAISESVAAGTYYVLVSGATSSAAWGFDTSGDGSYATEAYATAMQATETITGSGDASSMYGVRLDFTAGGGSTYAPPPRQSFPMVLLNF